jgi:predicted GTPase
MNIKIEIIEAAAKDIEDMKVIIIDKPNAMAATLTNSILAIVVIAIIDYSSNNNSTVDIPNIF